MAGGPSITTNTPVQVNQNVNVAGVPETTFSDPEYAITMKLGGVGAGQPIRISTLFNTATYQQNGGDENKYDVILTPNTTQLTVLLTNYIVLNKLNPNAPTPTKTGNDDTAAQKLLDVMSLNLFGTDVAQAAIINDSDFLDKDLTSLVSTALSTDANYIFQRYVELGGIAGDDVSIAQNINFEKLEVNSLKIPLYLNGQVLLPGHASGATFAWIYNCAGSYAPINKTDGSYATPLLLDFNVSVPRS